MIKCTNCGAKYDKKLEKCPYCEAPNVSADQITYHNKIDEIIREREEIVKKAPDKVVARSNKKIIFAVVAAVILFWVAFTAVIIISKQNSKQEYIVRQQEKEKLDEFLDNCDYEGLYNYIINSDIYVDYDKVREVYMIYLDYVSIKDSMYMYDLFYAEGDEDVKIDIHARAMVDYYYLARAYDSYINDTKRLGNDEHIQAIYDDGVTLVKEKYGYSDEILELIKQTGDSVDKYYESENYIHIAKKVLEQE